MASRNKAKKAGLAVIRGTVYPYDVVTCLGGSRDDILAFMEKHFVNALTDKDKRALQLTGRGRVIHLDNRAFVLWTKAFPQDPETYSYLSHEIFHAVDLMLRYAGLSLSDDSDEAWAYAIQWLTKEIYSTFEL